MRISDWSSDVCSSDLFELRDIPSHAELQFSMIGYETERVRLQNNRTVNIRLQRKRQRLEGLSVVAYTSSDLTEGNSRTTTSEFTMEIESDDASPKDRPVYSFASIEKMPVFPGGKEELLRHVAKNYRYPRKARDNKVEGLIEVGFIVDEKGNVTQAEILKGIGSGCDEEELRIVKDLPKREPGEQNGETGREAR